MKNSMATKDVVKEREPCYESMKENMEDCRDVTKEQDKSNARTLASWGWKFECEEGNSDRKDYSSTR